MKRILSIVTIVMICIEMCSCGSENVIEKKYVQSSQAVEDINLEQRGQNESIERSIDELYSHNEPLVIRENVYYGGVLIQYTTYEYDDRNRYITVCYYQINPKNYKVDLCIKEKYEYDEFFCYKETTHVKNNYTTEDIYDLHGNEILAQTVDEDYEHINTQQYIYKYIADTAMMQEEYCYAGEEMRFAYHMVKRSDEYGNETFLLKQNRRETYIRKTDYTYDSDGNVLEQTIADEKENIQEDIEKNILYVTYAYDEEGKLTDEVQKLVMEPDVCDGIGSIERHTYEYDSQGRLVRDTKNTVYEAEYHGDEPVEVTEYVY